MKTLRLLLTACISGLPLVANELHAEEASSASPGRPIVLQVQWYPQAQFAGYLMAQKKGFFEEAGLGRVEIHWSGAGESSLKELLDGKADFCTAWLSNAVVRRTQGDPVVLLAQVVQRSTMMLVVRSNSGIMRPADMAGKRVGLWGGDFDVLPTAFFSKFHVQPEIVPQSSSIVPFLRGAVDVASAMHYNEYHKLLEAGLREKDLKVFLLSEYGLDFPEDGLYCTETTRRQRADTCAAMVAAVSRGWDYAANHQGETLDAVMDWCAQAHVRTSRNHQSWMFCSMLKAVSPESGDASAQFGHLSRSAYDEVTNLLQRQGLIEESPRYDQFYQPPGSTRVRKISPAH